MQDIPKFDVEHALSMYATSFVLMPAGGIYDEAVVESFKPNLATCHIYVIGLMPKIDVVGVKAEQGRFVVSCEVAGRAYAVSWAMPPGASVAGDETGGWVMVLADGRRFALPADKIARRLQADYDALRFEVLYIGQSYGADGSRNALDRLTKHETLQKIAVKGVPATQRLTLLLLEIAPNRMITVFSPKAKEPSQGSNRIAQGLDKLFDTTEAERVALYEAALIRYFQPQYNKTFKDSFPSTNMKLLADCYDKDFNAVIAEICIDELPFKMFSAAAPAQQYHTAYFDLHADVDRKVFFSEQAPDD